MDILDETITNIDMALDLIDEIESRFMTLYYAFVEDE